MRCPKHLAAWSRVRIPWMHHSDIFSVDWWIKYGPGSLALISKISTFSKGFWFSPFYMGNRDKETSEYLGSKDIELSENPNRVLERCKHPFNLQLQVDFLITNWSSPKKLRRKTKHKNPCASFLYFYVWPYEPSWLQVAFDTAEDVTLQQQDELNLTISLQKQVLKAWQVLPLVGPTAQPWIIVEKSQDTLIWTKQT